MPYSNIPGVSHLYISNIHPKRHPHQKALSFCFHFPKPQAPSANQQYIYISYSPKEPSIHLLTSLPNHIPNNRIILTPIQLSLIHSRHPHLLRIIREMYPVGLRPKRLPLRRPRCPEFIRILRPNERSPVARDDRRETRIWRRFRRAPDRFHLGGMRASQPALLVRIRDDVPPVMPIAIPAAMGIDHLVQPDARTVIAEIAVGEGCGCPPGAFAGEGGFDLGKVGVELVELAGLEFGPVVFEEGVHVGGGVDVAGGEDCAFVGDAAWIC
jgi:hypothetical protein